MGKRIIVVGAGLGGLVCARRLMREGYEVLVFEKDDRVGGRLKTDLVDGFRIDRGFQVAFSAYPYLKREVDIKNLQPRFFAPGCKVVWKGRLREIRQDRPLSMLLSTFLDFTDKFRIKGYTSMLSSMSSQQVWQVEDRTTLEELKRNGIEGPIVEKFFRPFFGGVFLDRSLETSHKAFRYVWKMLADGKTFVPALGMEEIPKQIAGDLPVGTVRTGTAVTKTLVSESTVRAVTLDSGEEVEADAVVLASDAPATASLGQVDAPVKGQACTTFSFDSDSSPPVGNLLVVNGNDPSRVNHVAVMSNVSQDYAPTGRTLVSATVLGDLGDSTDSVAQQVLQDMARWFPSSNTNTWRLLRADRIQFAQYAQPVGFGEKLPEATTDVTGLFLSGEQITYSSIDGACLSGAQTAAAVKQHLETV